MSELFPETREMKPWHLSRRSDPPQSKEAAHAAAPKLGAVQAELEAVVRKYPNRTVNELAAASGIRDPRRYGRRTNELVKAGRIRESGVRKCSMTGRNAATWVVCDEA